MKLNGSQVIAADRMAVWNALNDAEVLKRCISGCEEMNRTSPTQYDAIVKQKIGPVSATFKGEVTLSDVREGESLTLQGEGKGGVAGMAKGGAVVTLTDVEGGTLLSYDADASVAGKLAQLGSRLIDGVAQKMANGFFESFKAEVETGSGTGSTGGVSITNSANGGSAHASAAGGAAMVAAAGGAGAAATAWSSDTAQGARDSVDAHTGALHDAAAERMLNPAIGMGSGDIDMDDPEIGDIDVSSVDGGPSEGERAAAHDAGSRTMEGAGAGLGMAGAAAAAGGAIAAGSGMMDRARTGAQDAADHVGERVSAGISDAQGQIGAMGDDAAAASRAAMEGARDSVSGHMDAAGDAARGAMQDASDRTAGFDAARAAGSQGPDGAMPDVSGNLASLSGDFDPDAAVGNGRDHVGTTGDSASAGMAGAAAASAAGGAMAGASGMMDQARTGAQDAADRVGERVSAGIDDARGQVGAMGDDAAAASRTAMEGAQDSVSGHMDAAGDAARGAMQDGGDHLAATASSASSSASSAAGGTFSSASSSASAGMDQARDTTADLTGNDLTGHVDSDMQATASAAGAAPNTTLPEAGASGSGMSGAGMAAGAAAVGGIGAAVSGFAARAQDTFDDTHESVRERVIAAGGDVDEAKSWGDTKEHLGRAASETRDTAQDVYDAARARVEGDHDRASAEWNEAKTNASEAYGELKGAGEDAWTTGKGYAAEEAKAPKIGPLGQPWYLWIIGIIVLLVILWIL